jgi:hypothetical protein
MSASLCSCRSHGRQQHWRGFGCCDLSCRAIYDAAKLQLIRQSPKTRAGRFWERDASLSEVSRAYRTCLLAGEYQRLEDFRGVLVLIDGTLGVPLDSQHKVIGSSSFQGLDDAVVRTVRHDPQTISDCVR